MGRGSVFFDSSVIIAAMLSPKGGSFYVISQLHRRHTFTVNEYVLDEVQTVVKEKFAYDPALMKSFFRIVSLGRFEVARDPRDALVQEARLVINPEDAPILAGAVQTQGVLLTLDNHFFTDEALSFSKSKGLSILKPGDFIQSSRP